MINISKLYCDEVTPGDWLRYGKKGSRAKSEGEIVPKKASERRPIVVWNITRACNLKCVHCYNDSGADKKFNELSTSQAKAVLQQARQKPSWMTYHSSMCLRCCSPEVNR